MGACWAMNKDSLFFKIDEWFHNYISIETSSKTAKEKDLIIRKNIFKTIYYPPNSKLTFCLNCPKVIADICVHF